MLDITALQQKCRTRAEKTGDIAPTTVLPTVVQAAMLWTVPGAMDALVAGHRPDHMVLEVPVHFRRKLPVIIQLMMTTS